MTASSTFFRFTGVAGVTAGFITFLIWVLPFVHGHPASLAERVQLHTNPLYMTRQWLSFLNVFLVLLASWGLVVRRLPKALGAASTGMLFLLFYGVAELLGRSVMIFVREYRWTHQLLLETDSARIEVLQEAIRRFDEIWGGLFGLLLIAFICSASLFAVSMRGGIGLQRVVAWGLTLAAVLGSVTSLSLFVPSSTIRGIAHWGYPLIQPASRFVLGLWLLGQAKEVD
jgi:hypothetical protein